jgi:hypothetical protein
MGYRSNEAANSNLSKQRQMQRCIEIYLLHHLDKPKASEYKNYRLQVKKRLYKFNFVSV